MFYYNVFLLIVFVVCVTVPVSKTLKVIVIAIGKAMTIATTLAIVKVYAIGKAITTAITTANTKQTVPATTTTMSASEETSEFNPSEEDIRQYLQMTVFERKTFLRNLPSPKDALKMTTCVYNKIVNIANYNEL